MLKETAAVLYGKSVWERAERKYRIDEKTVVLILTGDDRELDRYALIHLQDYMDRKYADRALVICQDGEAYRQAKNTALPAGAQAYRWGRRRVRRLYRYYAFYLFSDKVVFTYTASPAENLLGRLLRETAVGEEEAVCLGLYRLRRVPGKEAGHV